MVTFINTHTSPCDLDSITRREIERTADDNGGCNGPCHNLSANGAWTAYCGKCPLRAKLEG